MGASGPVALALMAALTALGLLHLGWAFGLVWPGNDPASLAATVIGTHGGRMPGKAPTVLVALAIFTGAVLVFLVSARSFSAQPAAALALAAYGVLTAVFLLRGLSVFVPAVWRYADGTPFHRLNQLIYSPLCLLIA
ncbi:MAG TPA: DUF3995 domain-containing protein, partial [Phenylobacterium sp.]